MQEITVIQFGLPNFNMDMITAEAAAEAAAKLRASGRLIVEGESQPIKDVQVRYDQSDPRKGSVVVVIDDSSV